MKKIILCIILISVLFFGCSLGIEETKTDDSTFTIISWNVQNIFDGIDNGTEYEEYKSSSFWSDNLYRLRLSDIEKVFGYRVMENADIIVLNEVENENVVRDIISLSVFEKRGFRYYVCAGEDNGPIKTAVLSRKPFKSVRIHSVENARPVIEADFDSFTLFALHAKSKAGDEKSSSVLRYKTALTVNEISDKIEFDNPGKLMIIAGDFNEDWTDSNSMINTVSLSGRITDCPLIISGNRHDRWYCFWLDDSIMKNRNGSYFYNGKWSCIDNILLSDGEGLVDAGVIAEGILSKTDGTPNAWIRNIASGVSDHFPIWVEIKV